MDNRSGGSASPEENLRPAETEGAAEPSESLRPPERAADAPMNPPPAVNSSEASGEPAGDAPESGCAVDNSSAGGSPAYGGYYSYPYYAPYVRPGPPVREPIAYGRWDWRLALFAPVLGFLFIRIALLGGGLGVTVFTTLFVAVAAVWRGTQEGRPPRAAWGWLVAVLAAGIYFVLYDNAALRFPAAAALTALALYAVLALGGGRVKPRLGEYALYDLAGAAITVPFSHFTAAPRVIAAQARGMKKGRGVLVFLLGLLVAVPLVLIVGSLLQSADAAFESLWGRLTDWINEEAAVLLGQLILAVPVSLYLFGLFYGSGPHGGRPSAEEREKRAKRTAENVRVFPTGLVFGIITPLLMLYAVFFVSQTGYFLSAFGGDVYGAVNYSEYARRGFFELCAVSAINGAAIAVLLLLTRRDGSGKAARVFAVLLSVSSLLLIASAFSKMWLYIRTCGLTPLRVFTSVFMVWLFVVFVLVVLRSVRPSLPCARSILVSGALLFFLLCFADSDHLIAEYNVTLYETGRAETVDVALLGRMGPSSTPALIRLMDGEDELIAVQARNRLEQRAAEETPAWRGFTLARYLSDRRIKEALS